VDPPPAAFPGAPGAPDALGPPGAPGAPGPAGAELAIATAAEDAGVAVLVTEPGAQAAKTIETIPSNEIELLATRACPRRVNETCMLEWRCRS
jgi:hypothetical protein